MAELFVISILEVDGEVREVVRLHGGDVVDARGEPVLGVLVLGLVLEHAVRTAEGRKALASLAGAAPVARLREQVREPARLRQAFLPRVTKIATNFQKYPRSRIDKEKRVAIMIFKFEYQDKREILFFNFLSFIA